MRLLLLAAYHSIKMYTNACEGAQVSLLFTTRSCDALYRYDNKVVCRSRYRDQSLNPNVSMNLSFNNAMTYLAVVFIHIISTSHVRSIFYRLSYK